MDSVKPQNMWLQNECRTDAELREEEEGHSPVSENGQSVVTGMQKAAFGAEDVKDLGDQDISLYEGGW